MEIISYLCGFLCYFRYVLFFHPQSAIYDGINLYNIIDGAAVGHVEKRNISNAVHYYTLLFWK